MSVCHLLHSIRSHREFKLSYWACAAFALKPFQYVTVGDFRSWGFLDWLGKLFVGVFVDFLVRGLCEAVFLVKKDPPPSPPRTQRPCFFRIENRAFVFNNSKKRPFLIIGICSWTDQQKVRRFLLDTDVDRQCAKQISSANEEWCYSAPALSSARITDD